jgi:membrane protease YdiL (CAAX protease family)
MASRSSGNSVTRVLGLELRRIPAGIFWGMLALLCMVGPFLLSSLLAQGIFWLFDWTVEEQMLVEVLRENVGKPSLPVFFLTAAVVAPVAEEIMFRGFFYRALVNWTRYRWPPILLSGFVFSLFHFHALAILPLWVVGIFLAAVYDRTGNLWSAIFLHAFFNTVQVLVMMYEL